MKKVLIIGAGPAGLAAAIMLRQKGIDTTVLHREENTTFKVGENLSGKAVVTLKKLGIWEQFVADKHKPCYGNQSAWGSNSLTFQSLLHQTEQQSWLLDRTLFERRLKHRALELGVNLRSTGKNATLLQTDEKWRVTDPESGHTTAADFLMDASGRNSWVARHLQLERIKDDRLIGVTAFLRATGKPLTEASTLVESSEFGWWYTAPLPGKLMVCSFFTDADLYKKLRLQTPDGWKTHLFSTNYTLSRIKSGRYELAGAPTVTAADSSYMQYPVSHNRITVGDAAFSFDPLSAHGICAALQSGTDAASVVDGYFSGNARTLAEYHKLVTTVYKIYRTEHLKFYDMERRWPGSEFWQRRREVQGARLS